MPLTVSVNASRLSFFGASHSLPYQARIPSRALSSPIVNGSTLSGRNASLTSAYGTSSAEPQNSQRCAWRLASITDIAWQLRHLTYRFSICQPRLSSPMPRSAATRSCSTTAPVASIVAGEVVPQNGLTSACRAGFQTASAPQAGQANFCRAISCRASSGAPDGEASAIARRTDRQALDDPGARRTRERGALERPMNRSCRRPRQQHAGHWIRYPITRHAPSGSCSSVTVSREFSFFANVVRKRTIAYSPSGAPGMLLWNCVPICARCESAPSGALAAFSDSAQRSTVIASRNCLPAFFQLWAASPRSVSASQV